MDVSGIAAVATDLSQSRAADAIQLAVLKLAMQSQAQGVLQLVQAAAVNNPPNLGNRIDTYA